MKTIPLTKGLSAIVDDVDFIWLSRMNWCATKRRNTFYAQAYYPPTKKVVYMHRLILGFPPGKTDHRDCNGLNNRRRNLRVATQPNNSANQPKRRGTSRFKGVYWNKRDRIWRAQIGLNYGRLGLGDFHDERKAAMAYNRAAKKHFGEFARVNRILKEKAKPVLTGSGGQRHKRRALGREA